MCIPPKKPATVPKSENARYFAAKSQLKEADSTPRALSMPSSFSSFLMAVLMVKLTVMKTMIMRKTATMIMHALVTLELSFAPLNPRRESEATIEPKSDSCSVNAEMSKDCPTLVPPSGIFAR